jgi:hypothetical protein
MILRAIEELPIKAEAKPRPVWDVLFEHQSKLNGAKECWLITQPSHSALSGEIAANLLPEVFGKFDEGTIRAIALHDAGWSAFDSELIRASREPKNKTKVATSFMGTPPKEATSAWTGSVETALKASLLGGLLVSEHFRSIAQSQVKENPDKAKDMAAFARQEETRQQTLRPKIGLTPDDVERLVDGLRFCDLVSLYLCMGITRPIELPQQFQQHSFTLRASAEGIYQLIPSPFGQEQTYSFAALRHPRTKEVSSATFLCKITG